MTTALRDKARCRHDDAIVIDSRPTQGLSITRRRKECTKCNHRFTTHEVLREDYEELVRQSRLLFKLQGVSAELQKEIG